MDELAFARLEVIEAQIKALEKEYKAIYKEMTGMGRPRIEYEEMLECSECGKEKPLGEFYTTIKEGRTYYRRKCRECQKIHRNIAVEPKRVEGSQIKYGRPRKVVQEPKKTEVKRNYDLINETQNEAAANGMSYGQWVAQQYLKERRV